MPKEGGRDSHVILAPGTRTDEAVLEPDEAFTVLGNETRIRILQTLGKASRPLSFTELRNEVGIQQGAQFSYHLKKLLGLFVQKTDEGYVLGEAGKQMLRAILAGALTDTPSFEPTEIESQCPYCGETVEVWYENELFTARCTQCAGAIDSPELPEGVFLQYALPPASLQNRTPDEVLAAAHSLYGSKITALMEGVCPECGCEAAFTFPVCPDHEPTDNGLCETCRTRHKIWVTATCENCQYTRQFILWFVVMTNPAVVAFYYDHGVPWERVPIAKLTRENTPYVTDVTEEVLAEDPIHARLTIRVDNDELSIRIDENLSIMDHSVKSF